MGRAATPAGRGSTPAADFRLALTHDVDDPLVVPRRSSAVLARQLAADALVRRDPALAARRVRSWAGARRGASASTRTTPSTSSWTSASATASPAPSTSWPPRRRARATASTRLEHPWVARSSRRSMGAATRSATTRTSTPTATPSARARSSAGCARPPRDRRGSQSQWGGRQHYLRWENPSTWENWEGAGLDYDSTVGFADRRLPLGTSHEFAAFHLRRRRPLRLRERPLLVMDRTLFDYMGLSPRRPSRRSSRSRANAAGRRGR